MNLILLDAREVRSDGACVLHDRRALHIASVLKSKPGDELRLGLINGPLGAGVVVAVQPDKVNLQCRFEADPPAPPAADLLLALPRPKVMKRLWAQLAALGVGKIALTNAARVERCFFDTHVLEPSFYRPQLLEGLQQARDTRLPEISLHRRFRPLVEDELDTLFQAGLRLVAHPEAKGTIAAAMAEKPAARVLLAVGPEGGWIPFEMDLLRAHGFLPVGLGPRPLRTDTACIALLSLIHAGKRID
jgi:RsmE family RNA methyltransferase